MDAELESALEAFVTAALALSVVGVLVAARLRARAAKCVGRLLFEERGRSLLRALRLAWSAAALIAIGVTWPTAAGAPLATAALAVLALALALLTPDADAQQLGEAGVRRGWSARTFADLEEWRLTGEHLRWKLEGEWIACRAPVELHAELREKLERACPERESRFG